MNTNALIRISDENPTYSSLVPTTRKEKVAFYNAVESPEFRLNAFINKEFEFSNVYMEKTLIAEKDEEGNPTGVMHDAVKIVFITPEGKGILSTSMGILRSLYGIFSIFGTPDTWGNEPMKVVVKQVELGKNRTFRLEVID